MVKGEILFATMFSDILYHRSVQMCLQLEKGRFTNNDIILSKEHFDLEIADKIEIKSKEEIAYCEHLYFSYIVFNPHLYFSYIVFNPHLYFSYIVFNPHLYFSYIVFNPHLLQKVSAVNFMMERNNAVRVEI